MGNNIEGLLAFNRRKSEKAKNEYSPKNCLQCGAQIPYEKRQTKFCTRSCAASFNKNRLDTGKLKAKICPVCGGPKSNYWNTCSHACRKKFAYSSYIEKWLRGEESGSVKVATGTKGKCSVKASKKVREWLFVTRSNKCEKCGWAEVNSVTKLIPLQVHHIDGDGANNRPENLELLCPNCHSLTPTFGALNKDL